MRKPGLMPSFCTVDLPEYPAMPRRSRLRLRLEDRLAVRLLALEKIDDLLAGECFVFEQRLRDLLPVIALLQDDPARLLLACFDEAADLRIYEVGRLIGNVGTARDRMTKKDLLLVALVAHPAKLVRHAPFHHHGTCKVRRHLN